MVRRDRATVEHQSRYTHELRCQASERIRVVQPCLNDAGPKISYAACSNQNRTSDLRTFDPESSLDIREQGLRVRGAHRMWPPRQLCHDDSGTFGCGSMETSIGVHAGGAENPNVPAEAIMQADGGQDGLLLGAARTERIE